MKRIHTSIIFAGIGLIFLLGPNVQAAATVEGDDTFSQQLPIQEPDLQIGIPTIRFTPAEELIKQNQTEGERLLHVPYLAEYIRDVYKYAIAVAGVLSIIMIIFAGFQWVLSGGNPEGINASKKRIGNALIGLVLALGSYTLLYTINPALVEFKSLQIFYIQKAEEGLSEVEDSTYTGAPGELPTWNADTFTCPGTNYPSVGVIPESQLEEYQCPAIFGTIKTVPEMKDPLCKVGLILEQKGYTAKVQESYRTFEKQVEYWCDRGGKGGGAAVPGFSRHGQGKAVDIHLSDSHGTRFYTLGSGKQSLSKQCQVDQQLIRILAEAFYQADPKFNRLESEIWHFEYGTSGRSIGKYTGLPTSC